MTAVLILLALALAEPSSSPIRSHHGRIVRAIQDSRRRSETFRALVERLNQSDLIVYIESGRCPSSQVLSCLAVASGANSYRYLRITIDTDHSLPVIISQIAHELGHAVEIADAPDVIDSATLRGLYTRIGTTSAGRDVFETANAVKVATQVLQEVNLQHSHASALSPDPK